TLRARVAVGPGATRKNAIVVASSQETSGSDSTTPSSHQEDTQQTDAEYDPEAGTPPLDSQKIDMEEEIDELVKDPHTTDVEMEKFEQAQHQAGGKNTKSAEAKHTGHPKEIDFYAPDFDFEKWEQEEFGGPIATGSHDVVGDDDLMDYEDPSDVTPSRDGASLTRDDGELGDSHVDECEEEDFSGLPPIRRVAPRDPLYHVDAKQRWNNLNRELGVDFKQISVKPIPQHGPRRRIFVQHANKADFERARQLKFYLQPRNTNTFYHADAYGSALDPTKRVVTFDVNPTEEIGDVFTAVREWEQSQDRVKITDLWAQRTGDVSLATASEEPDDDEVEFTGLIIAVCEYIPPANSSKIKTLSATDLLWFPAFIMVSGSEMETNFHGRPEWCRGCRDGRFHYFHREQECPTPRCSDCHKRH
ncbi:hypothetical protein V8E36_001584, partial [Tilletia maclaganii]